MSRMPGAKWLGEHGSRPMGTIDIVCIHTIVGHAPAHAAHFSTTGAGALLQSRDTRFRSAANLNGNPRVIAIENADHGPEFKTWTGSDVPPLTDRQIDACARVLAWAHRAHGVPLQLCPDSRPGSRGLAYHRQGVDGNFEGFRFPGRRSGGEVWSEAHGKVCPGDRRIAQLPLILARAVDIVERGAVRATLLRPRALHGTPYRKFNCPDGIRRAARENRSIDLDGHITKDGRWANTHWARVGREGFRYTAASIKAGVPKRKLGRLVGARIEDLPWAVVETLETRGGDKIQGMGAALRLAGSLGVDVEVEPKGIPTLEQFVNLRDVAADAYGTDWRAHVIIKRLSVLLGWRRCLKRAKAAKFTTCLLRVPSGRGLPSYVDHYRR